MAEEGMAVAGACTESEVLEDLPCAPGLSFRVDRLQGEGGLLFVLAQGN